MKRRGLPPSPPPLPTGSGEREVSQNKIRPVLSEADRKESVCRARQSAAAGTCALSGCANGLNYGKAKPRITVTSAAAEATVC